MVEIVVPSVNIELRQFGRNRQGNVTAAEYKTALAALEMNHHKASKALGIGLRTSQRYALEGAPRIIALALEALALKFRGNEAA